MHIRSGFIGDLAVRDLTSYFTATTLDTVEVCIADRIWTTCLNTKYCAGTLAAALLSLLLVNCSTAFIHFHMA